MITSLQVVVPKTILSRKDLDPKKREDFERVTGIRKTRRWEWGRSSEVLELAARQIILERPDEVDAVFLVTQSPDRLSPCMAVDLVRIFGLPWNTPCWDINQSCDGFIYGLWLAENLPLYRVLLVCFDQLRYGAGSLEEAFIFSDALSVADISPTTTNPDLRVDRFSASFLTLPSGLPKLKADLAGGMVMDGGYVFDTVTREVPELLRVYCQDHHFLCQHQSNESMMRLVDIRSGFRGRSLYSIREYGNQSMCSIPTALAFNETKILGKRVLLAGYGAGFCAAITSLDWPEIRISSITEV